MLRNKSKITISLILLTLFCGVLSFSQESTDGKKKCAKYETLKQKDFVGEKISFQTVNADFRDILNYITEQYGFDFVLDKSIKTVPMTINAKNIPWNIALDSVLKSQLLRMRIKCGFIFISDKEKIEKEVLCESICCHFEKIEEDKAPLFTDFIQLKNIPKIKKKTEDNEENYFDYRIGIAKFISIMQKRVSKQGAIEFDCVSKTIILTDTRNNLNDLIKLVKYLDEVEFYKLTEEEYKEYKKYEICSLEKKTVKTK